MAGIWIRSGTVSVTNGSKKVTGVGTAWLTALTKAKKGCLFMLDNVPYEVDYVTLDTELYLVETFTGATASGKSYKIQPFTSDTIPDLSSRLASVLTYMATQYGNLQTWAAGSGNVTLTMPDGTQVTTPALSNLQPKDALLTALAGLTTSADKLAYFTGPDTVAQTALTAFARSLLDDADASTARITLGVPALTSQAGIDLNTVSATGIVKLNGECTNVPSGVADSGQGGHVLHLNWDTNAASQLYVPYSGSALMWRKKSAGAWGPWLQMHTDANLPVTTLTKNLLASSDKTSLALAGGVARSNKRSSGGSAIEWLKIAELVTAIGLNSSDFTAIVSGLENYGNSSGASALIRAGTRGVSNLRVFRLFGGSASVFGYVENATSGKTEIWLKRTAYCNATTVTVLNNNGATIDDSPIVVTTEPAGIVYVADSAFNFGTRPSWAEGTPWDSGNLTYETGTFTPTVYGATSAGAATYGSNRLGRYTRVGNRVFIQITVDWTGHTGSGEMRIGGLPFTAINIAAVSSAISLGIFTGFSFAGIPMGRVFSGSSYLRFTQCLSGASSESIISLPASATVLLTVVYEV